MKHQTPFTVCYFAVYPLLARCAAAAAAGINGLMSVASLAAAAADPVYPFVQCTHSERSKQNN